MRLWVASTGQDVVARRRVQRLHRSREHARGTHGVYLVTIRLPRTRASIGRWTNNVTASAGVSTMGLSGRFSEVLRRTGIPVRSPISSSSR